MTGIPRTLRIALGIVIVAGLIVVPMNFNRYGLFILSQWAVMTIAAMGLNLTLGYAGQVSLAQGAFVGIGAYAAAITRTPAAMRQYFPNSLIPCALRRGRGFPAGGTG